MPVLYLHGTADTLVPSKMSQQLFEKTRSPKQLKLFSNAGHNDVAQVGGAAYVQTVKNFVAQAKK
jgi:uncharacterized protein